jgi:hypothetical protein
MPLGYFYNKQTGGYFFMKKEQLIKALKNLDISVQKNNKVKRSDIVAALTKVVSENEYPKVKALKSVIENLKAEDINDMTAPDLVELLGKLYNMVHKHVGFELDQLLKGD